MSSFEKLFPNLSVSKNLRNQSVFAINLRVYYFTFNWKLINLKFIGSYCRNKNYLMPQMCYREDQAISFAIVKACYPFTIKGESFSLLCHQPEAFPTSLKTLTLSITQRSQCLPQIWNGQAKAQQHRQAHFWSFGHTLGTTCPIGLQSVIGTPKLLQIVTYLGIKSS